MKIGSLFAVRKLGDSEGTLLEQLRSTKIRV